MAERQSHGFMFEEYLEQMMDIYDNNDDYTAEHDAKVYTARGERHVSVKSTSNRGEICLGDFDRIANSKDHVILFDGRHDAHVPMPTRIIVHDLPLGFRGVFVGDQAQAVQGLIDDFRDYMLSDGNLDLEELRDEMGDPDLSFNDREFDPYWRRRRLEFVRAYRDLFDGDDIWIHPRPKRDHKNQKRLQCAIPRRYITPFYEAYAAFELVFQNDGSITVFDYTSHFAATDPDKRDLYDESFGHGSYDEYLFDDRGYDEEPGGCEQRAWRWLEHLIYVSL